MSTHISAHGRRALERKLGEMRPVERFAAPRSGWIRALREALGMSQAELGQRINVSQASVASMERSEAGRTIQLDTLARAADALDCDLVYALVPRRDLDLTVRDAARRKLSPHVRAVAQTMSLEDQASSPDAELVETELERLIASGRVWR